MNLKEKKTDKTYTIEIPEDELKVLERACFCYEDWYFGIDDKEKTNTALWLAFEFKFMLEREDDDE